MKNLYSVVIHLPENIIHLFREFKNQLYKESGKYSSCNSVAHITVVEFEATDDQLNKIRLKLIKIANEEKSFDAVFDRVICSEKSLSAFALPDKNSKEDFKKLLKKIRTELKIKGRNDAHISIGRKLSTDKIEISRRLFSNVYFDFHCNMIALRKFDNEIKQFEIVHIFPLSGHGNSEKQLSLDF